MSYGVKVSRSLVFKHGLSALHLVVGGNELEMRACNRVHDKLSIMHTFTTVSYTHLTLPTIYSV